MFRETMRKAATPLVVLGITLYLLGFVLFYLEFAEFFWFDPPDYFLGNLMHVVGFNLLLIGASIIPTITDKDINHSSRSHIGHLAFNIGAMIFITTTIFKLLPKMMTTLFGIGLIMLLIVLTISSYRQRKQNKSATA